MFKSVTITALAALSLTGCISAGGGGTVNVQVPSALAAAIKPYCGYVMAGSVGLPALQALLASQGVSLPAWATASATGLETVLEAACAAAPAKAHKAAAKMIRS